jgi:(1->4)-alpha-D-glucan 1-alpha-D-glucosylmutase
MDAALIERLRALRGIERRFTDFRGVPRHVSDDTVLRLLGAMGHSVGDEARLAGEADALEARDWIRVLPPVVVLRHDFTVPVTVLAPLLPLVRWRVEAEDGTLLRGEVAPASLPVLEERGRQGLWHVRLGLALPRLTPGYHRLVLEKADGTPLGGTRLIVAPARCFAPAPDCRLWGPAIQLYTLRSDRNWGIGDFTDLAGFAAGAAALGADVVGLNPLHALFPSEPALCGPYSPASRNFLNVLYIDPEAIPEFGSCDEARRLVSAPEFQRRLEALRAANFVDYVAVASCKMETLRLLYIEFETSASKSRRREFDLFVKKGGEELEKLALFYTAQEHFLGAGLVGGWPAWPAGWHDPDGPAAQALLGAEPGAMRFHCWLQWVAAEQLAAAHRRACEAGMAIGLYMDLAVGSNGGGAETWADQALYATGATVGAPPDPLALQGQDWGIPPMLPDELRERGYEPFVRLLRANMSQGGALRIDHVMCLLRLWWVPRGRPSAEGSYVYYPLDDLMAIVALESQRNRCLVIGEDLGTVPPQIPLAMREHGVYSYRVLFFEKDGERLRRPAEYPVDALVTVTTHDLPPLASFWEGSDIELRQQLGLYPDPGMADAARQERARDREAILAALAAEGLLPPGIETGERAPARMTESLAGAIQLFLALSPAALMVVQPDDWLLMNTPVNVPGTDREYPNWARKLDASWPALLARDSVRRLAVGIARARREAPARP